MRKCCSLPFKKRKAAAFSQAYQVFIKPTHPVSDIFRKHQQILYENNGVAISYSPNDTDKPFSFVRSQCQQRIFKSFA